VKVISVCHVTSELPDFEGNGGAGTATLGWCQELARNKDYRVSILFCTSNEISNVIQRKITARYRALGIELTVFRFKTNFDDDDLYQKKSYEIYMWLMDKNFDFVHFLDFDGAAFYSVSAQKTGLAFSRTHLNVVAHGSTRWATAISEKKFTNRDLIRIDMESYCLVNANSVISPSRYMLEWMRNHQLENKSANYHVETIVPGYTDNELDVFALKVNIPKEVVFYGRLEVRKGFFEFLNMAKDLLEINQEVLITFVGANQEINGINTQTIIQDELALYQERVSQLHFKDRNELRRYISDSTRLIVIPSLDENFAFTIFESLAWGANVIASNVGGSQEFFLGGAGNSKLFHPNSMSLKAKVLEILESGIKPEMSWTTSVENATGKLNKFYELERSKLAERTEINLSEALVTVCIVHFERPLMLKEALQSLIAQNYKNIEVIVVDDGSRDNLSPIVLEELESSILPFRFKVCRTNDIKLGAARNIGSLESRGHYIIFMDDDNLALPDMVSNMVSGITKSGADVLVALNESFSDSTQRVADFTYLPLGASTYSGLHLNTFGDAHAIWVLSKFREIGGFDWEYLGAEDWAIYAKARMKNLTIQVMPKSVYRYRLHDNNLMLRTKNLNRLEQRVKFLYEDFQGDVFPFVNRDLVGGPTEGTHANQGQISVRDMNTKEGLIRILSVVWLKLNQGKRITNIDSISMYRKYLPKIRKFLKRFGVKKATIFAFRLAIQGTTLVIKSNRLQDSDFNFYYFRFSKKQTYKILNGSKLYLFSLTETTLELELTPQISSHNEVLTISISEGYNELNLAQQFSSSTVELKNYIRYKLLIKSKLKKIRIILT
jgi:glycosyltransferase involved in cell wall biosynthesis